MDELSPYGPGTGASADTADTRPARSRARFWLVVVVGLLVAPVVLAGVGLVNGFALGDSEPTNAGLSTAAFIAVPVVYGSTCLFVLGAAVRRGARRETILAECLTLGLAVVVPVAGYLVIFPPPPDPGPVVDSGPDYATSYSSNIIGSMYWAPEFIEAVEAAGDDAALVAAIEGFEYPNAAGDSVSYTYDVDVTAFEGAGQSGLPARGVLKVTVDVEAGQWDDGGAVDQWSAGTATTCSSFRSSAVAGLHDLQPVDCADADVVPPAREPEPQAAEPPPTGPASPPPPTDPEAIRLLDLLGSLEPHASEDAVVRVVGGGFPGEFLETGRSDAAIVVVVGEWEDCLVGVLPVDDAPFLFSDFDRILLTRGEMGCTPQLYLNPVTTH